jgi:hypothetical protein
MISRHWKGIARPGQAEGYVDHLRRDVFPKLAAIPGFVRATVVPPIVQAMMAAYDRDVVRYELADTYEPAAPPQ